MSRAEERTPSSSFVKLTHSDVEACLRTAPQQLFGRSNSFCPPYSPHSQWAVSLVSFFAFGVVASSKLPPIPDTASSFSLAVQAWFAVILAWSPLLAWLLLTDPRSRPATSICCDVEGGCTPCIVRCRHGCIFTPPARKAKHCRRCDKCVDGFDHHCLWLNTCIGARNYRPWIVFVVLLFIWTLLSCFISWSALLRSLPVKSRTLAVGHRPVAFATGLLTAATSCWLFLLLGLHGYLSYLGITTWEWAKLADAEAEEPHSPHRRLKDMLALCWGGKRKRKYISSAVARPIYVAVNGKPSATFKVPSPLISRRLGTPLLSFRSLPELADSESEAIASSHAVRRIALEQDVTPSSGWGKHTWRRRISLSSIATLEDSSQEDLVVPKRTLRANGEHISPAVQIAFSDDL